MPGWGTKILYATQHSQEKKKKNKNWKVSHKNRDFKDFPRGSSG